MRLVLSAVTALALAAPALAEEPAAALLNATKAYRIGDTVADLSAKDIDGAEWRLSAAREVTDEAALAAVRAAAADYGGKPDAKAEDALDSLPGLKADPTLRTEFGRKVGRAFGLFPSTQAVEAWKTLGDAAAWARGAANAPIVLFWWSPKCATSARYEERIVEIFEQTGARLFPVATNFGDDDASIRDYLKAKGLPYRVLIDREAVLADLFGAKRTPHAFVIDEKGRLRYSGAIDDEKEEGRSDWLLAALKAVADGGAVDVLMTEPKG